MPLELFGTRKQTLGEYLENLGEYETFIHSNLMVPALFLHEKANQEVGCDNVARNLDFADLAIGLSANTINIRSESAERA
jgi:hypothetical protein